MCQLIRVLTSRNHVKGSHQRYIFNACLLSDYHKYRQILLSFIRTENQFYLFIIFEKGIFYIVQ